MVELKRMPFMKGELLFYDSVLMMTDRQAEMMTYSRLDCGYVQTNYNLVALFSPFKYTRFEMVNYTHSPMSFGSGKAYVSKLDINKCYPYALKRISKLRFIDQVFCVRQTYKVKEFVPEDNWFYEVGYDYSEMDGVSDEFDMFARRMSVLTNMVNVQSCNTIEYFQLLIGKMPVKITVNYKYSTLECQPETNRFDMLLPPYKNEYFDYLKTQLPQSEWSKKCKLVSNTAI